MATIAPGIVKTSTAISTMVSPFALCCSGGIVVVERSLFVDYEHYSVYCGRVVERTLEQIEIAHFLPGNPSSTLLISGKMENGELGTKILIVWEMSLL
jgi:hypothetical protein